MKRLAHSIVLLSLVLTACGSSGTASTCAAYWFDTVGACLPDGWVSLDRVALDERGAPEDVVVAFQMKDAVAGQFPTVTVTQEPLANPVTPASYSDATIRSVSILPGYKLVDKKSTKIDDVSLSVHIFLAQPVPGEPQRRFYQVSTTKEKTGYTVTATTPVSVPATLDADVIKILGSVTFVVPVTSSAPTK
ncbi:MAG: hypothetical protein PHE68_03840 [Candidatus Peribacteraceae bacterium]|nr:hypothetical protein [Candidatus Peribacteraceae bacterium]MDD5074280.1 hypothetical protein [Candidatus Peribacteraceae bacterium]